MNIIQSDFDQLALLDMAGWEHNRHSHGYLLRQVPQNCGKVLEIGCGTGSFSRPLSQYAERVFALDLSPMMLEIARQRSTPYQNIEYRVADVLTWDFPKEQFDCIVSIATMPPIPFESIMAQMKSSLKINGKIMILDLYEAEGIRDLWASILAIPLHTVLKRKNTGRLRESKEVGEAWAKHSVNDICLPVSEVRRLCRDLLGALIKKHILWRYSIIWKKSGI